MSRLVSHACLIQLPSATVREWLTRPLKITDHRHIAYWYFNEWSFYEEVECGIFILLQTSIRHFFVYCGNWFICHVFSEYARPSLLCHPSADCEPVCILHCTLLSFHLWGKLSPARLCTSRLLLLIKKMDRAISHWIICLYMYVVPFICMAECSE